MEYLGSIIISVVTFVAGFPVFVDGHWSVKGLFVNLGCITLWLIVCSMLDKKKDK